MAYARVLTYASSTGAGNWDDEQHAMNEYAVREMAKVRMHTGKRVRYETRQFPQNEGIRVIFRKLVPGKNEHWLNEAACFITSPIMPPYNKPPYNDNCHSEIIMDIAPGCTVRIGTMYKQGEEQIDAEGNRVTVWKPGSLFIREVTKEDEAEFKELKHYAPPFVLRTSREAETRLLCFALRNLGAPFDERAYKMRALLPVTPGVGYYDPAINDVRSDSPPNQAYYCTQLCVLLIQAAAYEHQRVRQSSQSIVKEASMEWEWPQAMCQHRATTYTPNNLYIMLSTLPDVKRSAVRPDQLLSRIGRM